MALNLVHMVGTAGLEPATSASRTLRATKLRYVPICAGSILGSGTLEPRLDPNPINAEFVHAIDREPDAVDLNPCPLLGDVTGQTQKQAADRRIHPGVRRRVQPPDL